MTDQTDEGSATGPFAPMEARLVDSLPEDEGWQFEPKWDGFRCVAVKRGMDVDLFAKSGKPLARFFPEVAELVRALPGDRFILDGELCIAIGESLSFEALQQRLHPAASRIAKLARETPAMLILFDMMEDQRGESLVALPLGERRLRLEAYLEQAMAPGVRLSPMTRERGVALDWLAHAGGALDGVVAKQVELPYLSGERAMLKVKRMRTADCVVGGFRYGSGSDQAGSLLLGLYDGRGELDHVGFTSMIANAERAALTQRLEALRGGPGFTGKAPGGPSRWSTERTERYEPLRHELVVEVRYDHVTGDRFRHGTRLVRWRPDKAPRQCTMDQLEREARPAKLIRDMVEAP